MGTVGTATVLGAEVVVELQAQAPGRLWDTVKMVPWDRWPFHKEWCKGTQNCSIPEGSILKDVHNKNEMINYYHFQIRSKEYFVAYDIPKNGN